MAPPQSMTVAEVARQEGISTATLYNWRKVARERGAVLPSRSSAPGQWSSEDKFRVVLETVSLSEAEFSEYCRSNGLLPEWVEAWRRACMGANASEEDRQRQVRHAGKAERQQIKKLKAELRYKDKALAATFLETLYDLGIAPSRSRPRVSNDNAYSEALFRTLKYRPGFPAEGFATLEQARQWVLQFTQWYNNEHRHSALNYVTPAQRHNGEAKSVLIEIGRASCRERG